MFKVIGTAPRIDILFETTNHKSHINFTRTDVVSVGRAKDNIIRLTHDFVSNYHGAFYKINNQWFYEDFSRQNVGSILFRKNKKFPFHKKRVPVFQNYKILIEFNQGKRSYFFRYVLTLTKI